MARTHQNFAGLFGANTQRSQVSQASDRKIRQAAVNEEKLYHLKGQWTLADKERQLIRLN